MLRHLVNEALRDVWCSPRQDNLHILQLHRLTAKYGALGVVKVLGRDVSLPSTTKRYHVYQIGQLSPAYLGMLAVKPLWLPERWTAFSTAIDATNVQVDIYTDKGIMLPRFKSFYMFNNDRNLIVAIEIEKKVNADLDIDRVFMKFYKNALLRNMSDIPGREGLEIHGDVPLSSDALSKLINKYKELSSRDGYVSCYVNGNVVDAVDAYTCKVGDVIEYFYDSTVYKVINLNASTLPVFHSELDLSLKYIIHWPGSEPHYVIYNDDIDIDIIYRPIANRFKGVYYNRNHRSSLRNITHRDYSLPVDNIVEAVRNIQDLDRQAPITHDKYIIRLKIKESYPKRPLIKDSNRVFELYKLPEEKIVQAMTGTNSTVDFWKAQELEKSPYVQVMGSSYDDITLGLVQEMYGYNGITSATATSPLPTYIESNLNKVVLPVAYRINSTCYEYDAQGKYIAKGYVRENDDYYASPACKIVEPIVGMALDHHGDTYGEDLIPVPRHDFRVYMTYKRNGVVDNELWKDVTDSIHYRIENGVLMWNYHEIEQWLCVRTDAAFYAKDFNVVEDSGVLRFKLSETFGEQEVDMQIPRGDIDVFINGYSAVNNLDYKIDFPWIYINNTKFLNRPVNGSTQKIHVRMTGFCESDFSIKCAEDTGFIRHGTLSDNHRFDVRDDKVLRIIVDGKLKTRGDVTFAEDTSVASVLNTINGQPYQVKSPIIPIRDLVNYNTYELKEKSKERDVLVANYLGEYGKSTDKGPISAIPQRYMLCSPFLNRATHFLRNNIITDDQISANFNDMWIEQVMQADLHLLKSDPISIENRVSDDYVIVAPHRYNTQITLSVLKLRFLNRLIQLYSSVPIDIRQFYLVSEEL